MMLVEERGLTAEAAWEPWGRQHRMASPAVAATCTGWRVCAGRSGATRAAAIGDGGGAAGDAAGDAEGDVDGDFDGDVDDAGGQRWGKGREVDCGH